MFDYVLKQTDWSIEKQSRYMGQLHNMFTNPYYKDYVGVYEAIVKTGEVYVQMD
jgi:hypothetical protein